MKYAVLPPTAANRVYGAAAPALAAAELHYVTGVDVDVLELGGLAYLTFEADALDTRVVSNLSGVHALFALEGDLLRPITIDRRQVCDDDLITIPRYVGKTNEQFTKLLVNMTLRASGRSFDDELVLLDPLCGRGTTLSQAMIYGWHARGIEVDRKDVDAYRIFLLRWLQDKRIKHTSEWGRAGRLTVRYGYGRRTDDDGRTIDVATGDTVDAPTLFGKASVDLIVADLPYGVQHGSRTESLRRSPEQLVIDAAPGWAKVLKPDGALGLSWNLRTLGRDAMRAVLRGAGFVPDPRLDAHPFEHVVDRSITRDLIVARLY